MCRFFVLALIISAVPCWARTIKVDDNGPADFNTIQAAINNANDGDTILIADGIYSDSGNYSIDLLGKVITVKSENGPVNCIIDCRHYGPGFYFGNGTGIDTILEGVTVTRGTSHYGGGIYCDNSSPTIKNCIIKGNIAYSDGGGIYSDGNSSIIGCIIEKNRSAFGGGVTTYLGRITDCLIVANRANADGGGIYGGGGYEGNITNCIISGNEAGGWGGGVSECGAWWSDERVNIRNCTISFNKAGLIYEGADSGGLYDCYGDIRNCLI